ncbi:MAG: hypothetical protein ABFS56_15360 [Pseudomonadota bacterium]
MKLKFQVIFFTLLLGLAGCDNGEAEKPTAEKPAAEKPANQLDQAEGISYAQLDEIINIPEDEFVEEISDMSPPEEYEFAEMPNDAMALPEDEGEEEALYDEENEPMGDE